MRKERFAAGGRPKKIAMTSDAEAASESAASEPALLGERIILVGRLAGMLRPEAVEAIRRHGGQIVDLDDDSATLVVLGDEHADVATALGKSASEHPALLEAIERQRVAAICESELWRRIGLVDDCQVRRLYTPAMLAELIGVPSAAIRHWRRIGALREVRCVRRLPYFDFEEVAVAKRLGQLHAAGCSLRTIDRRLDQLARLLPGVERPIADPRIVVEQRRILLRRGEELAEPHGQRLLPFGESVDSATSSPGGRQRPNVLQFIGETPEAPVDRQSSLSLAEQLEQEALDWLDVGDYRRAAESYRTILLANGPSADLLFSLADVLYRSGDLTAARERFYAVLELDEQYVEARANLGCVLAELGELPLAVAAFEGALERHPDFADVHFHLAGTLDRLQQPAESAFHYRAFLALAPESPWAVAARDRLLDLDAAPADVDATLPLLSEPATP